jgi:hypothetical protein
MKTIKLTETDLHFIRNHYEAELADAETYIKQVKEILKKLGKNPIIEDVIVKEVKKRGPKPKTVVAAEPKAAKKRGRPPKVNLPVTADKSLPVPAIKPAPGLKKTTAKKIIRKRRSGNKRRRGGGRVFLVPLSKPIQFKEKPQTEPEGEQGSSSPETMKD